MSSSSSCNSKRRILLPVPQYQGPSRPRAHEHKRAWPRWKHCVRALLTLLSAVVGRERQEAVITAIFRHRTVKFVLGCGPDGSRGHPCRVRAGYLDRILPGSCTIQRWSMGRANSTVVEETQLAPSSGIEVQVVPRLRGKETEDAGENSWKGLLFQVYKSLDCVVRLIASASLFQAL